MSAPAIKVSPSSKHYFLLSHHKFPPSSRIIRSTSNRVRLESEHTAADVGLNWIFGGHRANT